jgi:hypothetical protein
MPTTPNMSLVLPTVGDTANTWDSVLNTAFGLIDAHNHTPGLGVLVPTAGLGINADLTLAGFATLHTKASVYDQVAAAGVAGYANAVFVNSADANLYFRNAGGTNVQITSGNTINVSLVGGIGGDYAAVGALVQYNDAARAYWLQQEGAPRPWAALSTGDISLFQKAASIVNSVNLKSPNALAATYTLTFPAALPGATALAQQVDTAGNITWSNTFAALLVAPDFKNNAGLVLTIPASMFNAQQGGTAVVGGTSGAVMAMTWTGTDIITVAIPLKQGDQITGYSAYCTKASNNTVSLSSRLASVNTNTGSEVWASPGNSNTGTGQLALFENSLGITLTTPGQTEVYLVLKTTSANAGDFCYCVTVTYVRP